MQTDNFIKLGNGRTLGYADYGDPTGFPILYFHGGQESRLSSSFMDLPAKKLQIRIISPDRPGVGLSSFQANRQFLDWGHDMEEFTKTLGLGRFSIFGLSGGAPHVLSCLATGQSKVENASIIAGATPYDYKGSLKGMWLPVKILHWLASWRSDTVLRKAIQYDRDQLMNKPEKRLKQLQSHLPGPDKKLLSGRPEFAWEFIEGSKEAYKQGIDAVVQEWKMYVNDWQINLGTIHFPVNLWYGSCDKMAPVSRGGYYKSQLANSCLHTVENEGHFSLIRNHLEAILLELRSEKKEATGPL